MKKTISYLLVIAIVLVMLFAFTATAYAANEVSWSANFSPSSMTSGGKVTFSTSVKNISSDEIKNITLQYPDGTSISLADSLPAGESISRVDENYTMETSDLGVKQQFKLIYTTLDNVQHTLTGEASVAKKAGKVSLSGSSSANKTTVEKAEDKVTITFTFKNTGDVTLTDCRLYADPINGGSELTQSPFTLEPGNSKTLTYTAPVTKTMDVKPVLKYKANGSSGSYSTNTIEIKLGDEEKGPAGLSVSAVSNTATALPGDKVEITVTVMNSGEVPVNNIVVKDSDGNKISLNATSLDPGKTASGKVTYTFEEAATYMFDVTAQDEKGITVDSSSTPVIVNMAESEEETSAPESSVPAGLYIDVIADRNEFEEAGFVNFDITVTNTSDIVLSDITVTEATLGEIAVIPTMGTDVKLIEHSAEVKETTDYVFTVSAKLEDGTIVSATTDAVTVVVKGEELDIMMIILIIIIIAVVVLLIIWFVLKKKNAKGQGHDPEGGRRASGEQKAAPQRSQRHVDNQYSAPKASNEMHRPMRTRSSQYYQQPQTEEAPVQHKPNYNAAELDLSGAAARSAEAAHVNNEEKPVEQVYRRAINVAPKAEEKAPVQNARKRFGDRNNF